MPSRAIKGMITDSGWEIFKEVSDELGSGGNFCVRYLARSEQGKVGFLKAMDLTRATSLEHLKGLISEYLFEQKISEQCHRKGMSHIASAIDSGELTPPGYESMGVNGTVYYLIFEKADGDFRQKHFDAKKKQWIHAFRAAHHVAIGAAQLHRSGIAHQDIKPSNILSFSNENFKVSDLGRVTDSSGESPFSGMRYTGDTSYNPPEMLHGSYRINGFSERYLSDIYLVGSLLFHIVEGVQITAILKQEAELINNRIRWLNYEEALPIWMTAFNAVLERFYENCQILFPNEMAYSLKITVAEMCSPDISRRGRKGINNSICSMERYVGKAANIVRLALVHGV